MTKKNKIVAERRKEIDGEIIINGEIINRIEKEQIQYKRNGNKREIGTVETDTGIDLRSRNRRRRRRNDK